jgi:hypothetical protein
VAQSTVSTLANFAIYNSYCTVSSINIQWIHITCEDLDTFIGIFGSINEYTPTIV